ncbi:hypothetical protein DICPUDRAFT_86464 [Dictyostelium purpureum]|uniref:alpha-1,2-Mannosidase n=1 Tax=Dictyostelium purpureum TaxID=5786 RepID=F0ZBS8_DICPU|nr:uncharacterized protein DICPUDRAFT_86464 [Dictyostelium purpureum]EGC38588.1 hypothetical protein DICPUDRAFT_86464 [Dictyostelium purpureum]|eukprot:XP_003284867.1 hypothetical protein DICPUDRAFT_86464 [Dictyostelium purpureum]
MKFAWDSYKNGSWGYDEWAPAYFIGKNWLGALGLTIIDSLDTLHIMDMKDELYDGREWLSNLKYSNTTGHEISVFEFNIRYLGGCLAMYDLTGDVVYLEKAVEFGDLLMLAFSDSFPFPYAFLNIKTKYARNKGGNCLVLAMFGTMSLEFTRLSDLTGDSKYKDRVDIILDSLAKMKTKYNGLYPCMVSMDATEFCYSSISLGAKGDSFYEYLLKMWIYTDGEEKYSRLFVASADSIIKYLYRVTKAGHGFIGKIKDDRLEELNEHLTCFAGGMFALASVTNITGNTEKNEIYMQVAKEITKTCVQSYFKSPTGLGPEIFKFDPVTGEILLNDVNLYILRPETIESLFILYRLTGDIIYQEWGWKIYKSIELHCRVPNGYIGLKNIITGFKGTTQQSYFMSETLKYLYLLFVDSSIIPLDKYVFNTEAHPIKIKYNNSN